MKGERFNFHLKKYRHFLNDGNYVFYENYQIHFFYKILEK